MGFGGQLTGVGSVDSTGNVIVLIEASMPRFDSFRVFEKTIQLICQDRCETLARTYSKAMVEALNGSRVLIVQRIDGRGIEMDKYQIGRLERA